MRAYEKSSSSGDRELIQIISDMVVVSSQRRGSIILLFPDHYFLFMVRLMDHHELHQLRRG